MVFLAIISKTVNNQFFNPYIPGKIFSRSFQKCMGCNIDFYRFRDKRIKHQHQRLNSYLGDYNAIPYFYAICYTVYTLYFYRDSVPWTPAGGFSPDPYYLP